MRLRFRTILVPVFCGVVFLTVAINTLSLFLLGKEGLLETLEKLPFTGRHASQFGDLYDSNNYNVPPDVIQFNSSIPSIRFKVCDSCSEPLIIQVGPQTSQYILQVAQTIRIKYLQRYGRRSPKKGGSNLPVMRRLRSFLTRPEGRKANKEVTSYPKTWASIKDWPFPDSLRLAVVGNVLKAAESAKIENATSPLARQGTQLKLELQLEGGQGAFFKPAWYNRMNLSLNGDTVYGGKDRHFGEIAAFYLNLLLGYNSAPVVTGRRLRAEEVYDVASDELKATFFEDVEGRLCFYGTCHFCRKEASICMFPEEELEGALVLLMKRKFRTFLNPWRRTYRPNVPAPWENYPNFCQRLQTGLFLQYSRADAILDVVAVAVFDFLIGNGDRHRFETLMRSEKLGNSHSGRILLIDNGKSFGSPDEDFIDILAPLFQCCKIRDSLYQVLKKMEGNLGKFMAEIIKDDPLHPLLSNRNLQALDRKLSLVLATVSFCEHNVAQFNAQHDKKQERKVFY